MSLTQIVLTHMGRSCPSPLSNATSLVACSISARLAWRLVVTAMFTVHLCPRSLRWGVRRECCTSSELQPPKSRALPDLSFDRAFLNSPKLGCQSPGVANMGKSGRSSCRGHSFAFACIQTSEVVLMGGGVRSCRQALPSCPLCAAAYKLLAVSLLSPPSPMASSFSPSPLKGGVGTLMACCHRVLQSSRRAV